LIALGAFLVVWIGDSFFLRASTALSAFVPLAVRLIVCAVLLIVALLLFRSGHVVVSHERRPTGVLTTGAFRYVRHPLYLASLLTYLGLTVSTASLLTLGLTIGIFVFHDYIAGYEERFMETHFGEEYARYKRVTGKWIPRIPAASPAKARAREKDTR